MTNPFEIIDTRLARIETLLAELHKTQATKPKTPEKTDYLSVTEAARFLGVSNGSIYRYVMTGILPKRKFGNKLYFPKTMLEQLIERGM